MILAMGIQKSMIELDFRAKVIKYTKMQRTVDIVTKSLQSKYYTLSEYRDDLDVFDGSCQ